MFSFLFFFGYFIWGSDFFSFDKKGLVEGVNSLMGVLVGFYIASLAAVSSFESENLDSVMKGRPLTLKVFRHGAVEIEALTRRRFLAVIFGYCAIISIALYVFGLVYLNVSAHFHGYLYCFFKVFAWAVYFWMISSLLVVTLLGLHYLVERMHRS
ncbi:hypothetical protein [Marichromatium sp. PS1]|uniref:hypothetical protein n=1 Tax=Marichromatium sp. PS1 TaxID=3138932 RepID=UPI0034E8FF2F